MSTFVNLLLVLGFHQGLTLIIFYLIKSKGSIYSRILFTLIIGSLLLRLLEFLIFRIIGYHDTGHLVYVGVPLLLLIQPAIFFYLRSMNRPVKISNSHFLHFFPFALFTGLMLALFYLQDAEFKIQYHTLSRESGAISWLQMTFVAAITLQIVYYGWRSCSLYRHISSRFGDTRWFRTKLIVVYGFFFIYVFSLSQLIFNPKGYAAFEMVTFVTLSLGLQFLFIHFMHRGVHQATFQREKYYSSNLKGMDFGPLLSRLDVAMVEDKLYLDSQLRVNHLSRLLDLPNPYISQILNEGLKMKFNDYVNRYRIEESKRLLLDEEYSHLTILAVALDSGFSNKNTFNRTFKKYTGQTPTQYRKHKKD